VLLIWTMLKYRWVTLLSTALLSLRRGQRRLCCLRCYLQVFTRAYNLANTAGQQSHWHAASQVAFSTDKTTAQIRRRNKKLERFHSAPIVAVRWAVYISTSLRWSHKNGRFSRGCNATWIDAPRTLMFNWGCWNGPASVSLNRHPFCTRERK